MTPPLIVGNWKMHGTRAAAVSLARQIRRGLTSLKGAEVVLAPPFTALGAVRAVLSGSPVRLAGQNLHWETEGAFTGEIGPVMLRDIGCEFVIVGHSERRRLFHESDAAVADKIRAALRANLRPILCVGETLEERENGITEQVIARQIEVALNGLAKNAIENFTIAYEPVWAIGTGRNATPDQASQVHLGIRELLKKYFGQRRFRKARILYGGSVRPENAADLGRAAEVNGLLVGGASLKAEGFLSIIRSFVRA